MTDDPTPPTPGPSRPVDLAAAVAAVVADFRAEDPDRAGMSDAEIVAETVASVDTDDLATLVEADLMSDEVADAYRAVLAAPRDRLDAALTPTSTATDTRTGDAADTGSRAGAADVVGGPEVVGLVCPECGEDAVEQPSTALTPYDAHGQERPVYSHPDGEPLCPVAGPGGYQPAAPVEILAPDPSQRTAGDDSAPAGSSGPPNARGGAGGPTRAAGGDAAGHSDPDGPLWRTQLVVLDDDDLARMADALDRGDADEAERVFSSARPFTPHPGPGTKQGTDHEAGEGLDPLDHARAAVTAAGDAAQDAAAAVTTDAGTQDAGTQDAQDGVGDGAVDQDGWSR